MNKGDLAFPKNPYSQPGIRKRPFCEQVSMVTLRIFHQKSLREGKKHLSHSRETILVHTERTKKPPSPVASISRNNFQAVAAAAGFLALALAVIFFRLR